MGTGGGGVVIQPSSPKPAAPKTSFEQDLQYVKDGRFSYVFVFRRKDGAALDADDIAYLKSNSPPQTNMWAVDQTGNKKYVVAGSNFEFTADNMAALQKRFNIEDYSGK
jgi:hypothetical protein